ncbi:MAG: serine/threonine protein kinase [Cyclobacteriaceae bacterium]|nr:serine/threonine protein kinase [Cyclobacteriaceae bacterium]
MADLDDDHGVESIRAYVRQHPDIDVHTYVKRGLNGLVYFGTRKKLKDEVVLKFYWSYPQFDSSEEAVILRAIDHPNVLKIHDLRFIKPNNAYFLSPFISGGDLQGHIDSRAISTREALRLISGILAGVTEMHSNHGLVHRDLKPGNILLDIDRMHPIIADLGAVKKIGTADGYTSESKATLYYLPPESIVDKRYYFQSDIYQVGIIMFQLLNGFFPINEPLKWLTAKEKKQLDAIVNGQKRFDFQEEAIKTKIYKGKLIDTSTLPAYLDGSFKRVLNKALHWDYTKRFKNASEFLREVHRLSSTCPSYLWESGQLLISHESGTEYRITTKNGVHTLERKLPGKSWRKDNGHDGSFESILTVAREN